MNYKLLLSNTIQMVENSINDTIHTISYDQLNFDIGDKLYENLHINNISKADNLTPDELNKLSNILKGGAKLELEFNSKLSEEDSKNLIANLKFAGYLNLNSYFNQEKSAFSCTKKVWSKNKSKKNQNGNPWKSLKFDENANGKQELVLEDELFDPFDTYQKFSKETDCITRPKPCKNCNCGRAEKENQEKQKERDPNFKPECGKCYLGDAYRCAGCPYRGMPAFEPGDKVEFKNENTTAIGMQVEEEATKVNIKHKKVTIDL
jgi:hypothetical protein